MSEHVLGIDAGGTRTRALVVDLGGFVLGAAGAGAANLQGVGVEGVARGVGEAVTALRREDVPAAVFVAVAGLALEEERARVVAALRSGVLARVARVDAGPDLAAAQAGAFGGEPGVVAIAGTGAACYGRDGAGGEARAGGWGHGIGDLGGASELGRRALVAVTRAVDGTGPESALVEGVRVALGLRGWRELPRVLGERGLPRAFAELAPMVTAAADAGDEVARALVEEAAGGLARDAATVARRLWLDPPRVALVGGRAASERFAAGFERALAVELPVAERAQPMLPPVAGAALLAAERMERPFAGAALEALCSRLPASGRRPQA